MAYGFLRRVFEVFERHRTPVDVVTTSEVSVSVTIDDRRSLDAIVRDLEAFAEVRSEDAMALVCAVGEALRQRSARLAPRSSARSRACRSRWCRRAVAQERHRRPARRIRPRGDAAPARPLLRDRAQSGRAHGARHAPRSEADAPAPHRTRTDGAARRVLLRRLRLRGRRRADSAANPQGAGVTPERWPRRRRRDRLLDGGGHARQRRARSRAPASRSSSAPPAGWRDEAELREPCEQRASASWSRRTSRVGANVLAALAEQRRPSAGGQPTTTARCSTRRITGQAATRRRARR